MGRLQQPFLDVNLAGLVAAILDANPSVYYQANDTGATLVDSSGNAFDLTLSGAPLPANTTLMPCDPAGLYLRVPNGANKYLRANPLAVPFNGDWTLILTAVFLDFLEAVNIFTIAGAGELEAANAQINFGAAGTTGILQMFWETGAGVDVVTQAGIAVRTGVNYCLACRKNGVANTLDFFINGVKVATVAYANEPTGGTVAELAVGDTAANTTGGFIVGHCAFYLGQALTTTQIAGITRAAGLFGPP